MTTNGSYTAAEEVARRQERLDERQAARRDLHTDQLEELQRQIVYWREMYQVMVRILAAQHDDPALAWLDEIVHTRFSKLL